MKKMILILTAAMMLAGCSAPIDRTGYRQISMEEAVKMMEKEKKEEKVEFSSYSKNITLP